MFCQACGDIVAKKKLDQHKASCQGAQFTCLDCQTTFRGSSYRGHTSCISEAQKYQGNLYREPLKKGKEVRWKSQENVLLDSEAMPPPRKAHQAYVEEATESQQHSQLNTPVGAACSMQTSGPGIPAEAPMVPPTYVEEPVRASIPGQYDSSPLPPRAPSPPSVSRTPSPPAPQYNVFDFLDHSQGQTPSRHNTSESTADPVPAYTRSKPSKCPDPGPYVTPAPRSRHERPKSEMISQDNSQKKRKRQTIDVSAANSPPRSDEEMPDAFPPASHTGLTGGLNGLSAKDGRRHSSAVSSSKKRDESPGSPVKKHRSHKDLESKKVSKHSEKEKSSKVEAVKVKKHRDSRSDIGHTDRKISDSSRDHEKTHKKHHSTTSSRHHRHDDVLANGETSSRHRHHHRDRDPEADRPRSRDGPAVREREHVVTRERRPSQSPERKRRETKRIEYQYARSATGGVSVTHVATTTTPPRPTSSDSTSKVTRVRAGSRERAMNPTSQELIAKDKGPLAPFVPPDRLASMFMSLVNKGPESSRGCSINKVLKRFHRQRFGDGEAAEGGTLRLSRERRETEEDSLWRTVRLRRNEAGEIVLFF